MSVKSDADGFCAVESYKRWRRCLESRRPVLAHLAGRCWNCLSEGHVKATCTSLACCFGYLKEIALSPSGDAGEESVGALPDAVWTAVGGLICAGHALVVAAQVMVPL
jgi:hypothetical protein